MSDILIVDDDPKTRELLTEFLEDNNYNVYEAENGHEGLNIVRRYRPDLAIVDVVMPKIGGIETVKRIKRTNPDTTVFLMSGKTAGGSKKSLLRRVRKFGATRSFVKPINLTNLITNVKDFLGVPESDDTEESKNESEKKSLWKDRLLYSIVGFIFGIIIGFLI